MGNQLAWHLILFASALGG